MPASLPVPALQKRLLQWFRAEARDLPWRENREPYPVWLSEIMLQQTRVETGILYFNRFLLALPTVEALAGAGEETVLKLWEGLGYYSRARNLHQAAKIIVRERAGIFPLLAEEWRQLPGIGRYTAAAIASITCGERVAVLDGNVKRVLARLFLITGCIDTAKVDAELWALAERLVPARTKSRWPGDWNEAMMEFGAMVCTPRSPGCSTCPLAGFCRAYPANRQLEIPLRRKKTSVPLIEAVAVCLLHRGKVLIGKRPRGSMLAGLFELPGGRVKPDESHTEGLTRILEKDTGLTLTAERYLATIDHLYSHFHLRLHLYQGSRAGGRLHHNHYPELLWVTPSALTDYPMPRADRKALEAGHPFQR